MKKSIEAESRNNEHSKKKKKKKKKKSSARRNFSPNSSVAPHLGISTQEHRKAGLTCHCLPYTPTLFKNIPLLYVVLGEDLHGAS